MLKWIKYKICNDFDLDKGANIVLSAIEMMEIYDITIEQAFLLKYIIMVIGFYIIIGLYVLDYMIETHCPNIHIRLKKCNIV